MLPVLRTPDSTADLLREGYTFVSRRCDRLGTDGFRTRLMGRRIICLRGADAAAMFYSGGRFTRAGAMPPTTVRLLQDRGSVQALEDSAHRQRKLLFLHHLQGPGAADLPRIFAQEWADAVGQWRRADEVLLYAQVNEVLTRTASAWCGIPPEELDAGRRTRELAAMIDQAGGVGPAMWRALHLRRGTERWAADLIRRVRTGDLDPPEDTFLAAVARFRDADGQQLAAEVAAVEILNVLRPVVAVSRFVVFAAHAMLRYPQWQEWLASGDERDLRGFVQEVRRLYPFFPAIGGRARQAIDWQSDHIRKGDWVLLDLYGTNHDPRSWDEPEAFRPERFRDWSGDPSTLVPQGAGRYEDDHRCPGEPATIALMEEAVRRLTRHMRYRVPAQDLTIDLAHMPAMVASGFVIRDVEPVTVQER